MSVAYDVFLQAFLDKVTEYDFPSDQFERTSMVDRYMHRAIAEFGKICKYDLVSTADDNIREFAVDIPADEIIEIVDIVSEGMLVQWMRPYVYKQEVLENQITTRDYTTYSPANILNAIRSAYKEAQRDFVSMVREYSYRHGDLAVLHQ